MKMFFHTLDVLDKHGKHRKEYCIHRKEILSFLQRLTYNHSSTEVILGLGNPHNTLPALFTGLFEHLERFRNLTRAVIRIRHSEYCSKLF